MHMMWIFSQEDNVKITRNMTRRLLRLEKYSEPTIQKVMAFLEQVKNCPRDTSESETHSESEGAAAGSTTQHREAPALSLEYDATSDNQLELLREQEMKRRKVRSLESREAKAPREPALPLIHPEGGGRIGSPAARYLTDVEVLNGWLTQQTKLSKSSKKSGPGVAAPYSMATALPIAARIALTKKKKKRAPTRRKTTTARPKTTTRRRVRRVPQHEEEDEDDEEEDVASDSIEVVPVEKEDRMEDDDDEHEGGYEDAGFGDAGEGNADEDDEEEDDMIDLGGEEDAEDEEEDEDQLEASVIEGEELSDDLGLEGSLQFGSDSDE